MGFATLFFFCMIILTLTHVLDGVIQGSGNRKGFVLIYLVAGLAVSVLPAYNFNRYLSLNLLFVLSAASYVALLVKRKGAALRARETMLIPFVMLLFVLRLAWEYAFNNDGFYYVALSGTMLYCGLLVERQDDSALCAVFGVWFLQLLSILRYIIVDFYFHFDLANPDVVRWSLVCGLFSMILCHTVRSFKNRRKAGKRRAEPAAAGNGRNGK